MEIKNLPENTQYECDECNNNKRADVSLKICYMDERAFLCVEHAKKIVDELQKSLSEVKEEKSKRYVNEFFLACIQEFNPSLLNLNEVQKWKEEKNIKERNLNEFLGVES